MNGQAAPEEHAASLVPPANDQAAPEPGATAPEPSSTAGDAPVAPLRTSVGDEVRFWLRPLVLAVLAAFLLLLTWWDQRRVADAPIQPQVSTASPVPGAPATDPALIDTLHRLGTALLHRDARGLAGLADADGLVVASYGGALPESGYPVTETGRFTQEILNGAQISVLNWRFDAQGRVVVLVDGWRRRPLRLSANSTLEMTPLTALGLRTKSGAWYWRWVMPDTVGTLAQQAQSLVWQPWPS